MPDLFRPRGTASAMILTSLCSFAQVITSVDIYWPVLPGNRRNVHPQAILWNYFADFIRSGATSDLSRNEHIIRTTDRAGRAPTRPICDTRLMGGWASFSCFCSGRAGGRRLKIHAGPGGWAVDFSTGRPWASPGF